MSRMRRHHQGTSLHRWQKIKNHAGAQDALQDGNTGEPICTRPTAERNMFKQEPNLFFCICISLMLHGFNP